MNITIVSAFRNSSAHVPAYLTRLNALDWPKENVRAIFVEGDSTDDTLLQLQMACVADRRLKQIKCDTGKPHYGSIVHPERFQTLARVFNAGLDAVDLAWSDYVMFMPSDIVYQPDLLQRLTSWRKDLIAPFMWMSGRFYDIWGFVDLQGRNFQPFTPDEVGRYGDQPFRMAMVGGVILMRYEIVMAGCRYSPADVDHGLCRDAFAHGFSCWADPTTHVEHPPR